MQEKQQKIKDSIQMLTNQKGFLEYEYTNLLANPVQEAQFNVFSILLLFVPLFFIIYVIFYISKKDKYENWRNKKYELKQRIMELEYKIKELEDNLALML
ncbi:Hypothetical protein MYEA_3400 [Mycoplasma yeatsii 13926]|uniref:Transmembrane protein n=1 Tax=Mycoplasma yeatsii 13926 TaxID=1188240 RepID=S6G8V1_9MOLU|nr:two-component system sensor histidine kinase AtoS [Mycoplasma yeatsii]EOA07275.1 Hypothetical protein MYEA_3400 [Mycoplasma yeatsii 13926]